MKIKLTAFLLCLATLLSVGAAARADSADVTYTAAQVQSLCDGIVAYKEAQSGASGVQELVDGYLSDNAGSISEFYIIALSQYRSCSFDKYERSLLDYLDNNNVYSASSREKYALALIASGSTDGYITKTADEAVGGLGLMSLVFGLHILNNGYDSSLYSADGLVSEILSYRLSDGGWAVVGSRGDVDVTAMVLQALAPYRGRRSDVDEAVSGALELLSEKQLGSGGFSSMGAENCESSAQVLTALSALGVDPQRDGRFIKNGCTVLSAMLAYRNPDGSFSHTGGGYNESATVQAFYSLVAFLRYCRGQSPLYILDNANHSAPPSRSDGGSGEARAIDDNRQNDNVVRQDGGGSQSAGGNGGQSGGQATVKETGAPSTETSTPSGEATAAPTQSASVRPTYGGFQPAATADMAATSDESGSPRGGYKLYAILGIIAAAGVGCLVLFLLKKRGKKNYIAVALIAVLGIIFILLTNFESVDEHSDAADGDGGFTVTMSIRCDTVAGREKVNNYIPDDGIILDTTEFTVSEGDTVYSALLLANKKYAIPVDNRGAQGAAYIAGINFLYEFDYGDLSGWMYRVNGEFPEVGCQSFCLSEGDEIEWLYTTNIGKDLSD